MDSSSSGDFIYNDNEASNQIPSDGTDSRENIEIVSDSEIDSLKRKIYNCDYCDKIFKNIKLKYDHTRHH